MAKLFFHHRNERYIAEEYGIAVPLWFKRLVYVQILDSLDYVRPTLYVVFGRIGYMRYGWHLRIGIQ